MPESNPDISALRLAIDEIDSHILELINHRLSLARQIGALKAQGGIQIADPRREKKIIGRLLRTNNGPLDANGLQRIFETIIAAGHNVQQADRNQK